MIKIYYRGYILIRLRVIGTEWNICKKMKGLKSKEGDDYWEVSYATPIYGGWDIIVECSFTNLKDLDKIVTFMRMDDDLSKWIEETTTLVATKPDWTP